MIGQELNSFITIIESKSSKEGEERIRETKGREQDNSYFLEE